MLDRLFSIIAPHHCCGCGQSGDLLCSCCKNDILDEGFLQCVFCNNIVANSSLCSAHTLPYVDVWCVGWREGTLASVIDSYKFKGQRGAAKPLAELLASLLPELPTDTVIVPIATTPKNIRIRGYDHMRLIARQLSRLRGWSAKDVLVRQNNITQHFTKSAKVRREQAKTFFKTRQPLDAETPYLLIDDIYTTGSTIEAAAQCLREAGAEKVYVAVLSRQRGRNDQQIRKMV